MKKLLGFTLSELLMAVVVIGIIIAITIPVIVDTAPSAEKALIQRSYFTVTNTVRDMINNPYMYQVMDSATGVRYVGFDDTNSITFLGRTYSGNTKFIDLFINQLNIKGDVDTTSSNCNFESCSSCKTVTTSNGMKWSFGVPTNISTGDFIAYILIDVNGDGSPNCYQGGGCGSEYDQYRISVYKDGGILLNSADVWAREVISARTKLVE